MSAPATVPRQSGGDLPPHDTQAEQAVLGAIMLSTGALAEAMGTLRAEDFFTERHVEVFRTIVSLFSEGKPADPVAVAAELQRRGTLTRVGGAPYLHTLIETVATPASVGHYAQIVRENAILRRLGEAGQHIMQLTRTGGDPREAVHRAHAALGRVLGDEQGSDITPLSEMLDGALDELDQSAGDTDEQVVPTGFRDLDDLLGGGLRGGQLVIVAARPGIGKSTIALDAMRSCSVRRGWPSLMFSLEMSRTEITHRVMSAEAKVPLADMRSGRMSDSDWVRLARRVGEIEAAPLHIDDSANLTLPQIQAKARMMHARHGLRLLVVDYLQLATTGAREESRQAEVSTISRSLKLLAKELDVPVIAVSQLNRGPEQRHDKRPMLADLRESGSLEQDADIVMLLHRPDAAERDDPRAGEADVIVAKHRAGPTGTVTLAHQLHYSRFADLARGSQVAQADHGGWGE